MSIHVSNLVKNYDSRRAVDDVSFEVKRGEILGFLGPNGAGKTTTMKILACSMAPDSGEASVAGFSILHNPELVKASVGYLPESAPLYLDMYAIEYLEFAAALQGVPKEKIDGRVREMVRVCGLDDEKHKRIDELSKGYRQRVGLAQAMIHDPDVLILDEPTTGLDPNQIVEIRRLIRELGKRKTVILSTHILSEAEATCDRVVIIDKGKIVADGTAEELRRKSRAVETARVRVEDFGDEREAIDAVRALDEVADLRQAADEPGVWIVESREGAAHRKAIYNICVERGWTLLELTPLETGLEDVFRELTTTAD
ncbi:MAG: ATP-binding cassette domain-containing protein [Ignavibacteriales bacterium]|nr:ATP-binding cassette domain-containing protein [Ignavibacteriales bacterium]